MKTTDLSKILSVIFNVSFLLCISLPGYTQNNRQSITQNQSTELKRIGVMISNGKPINAVQDEWKTVLNNNKGINTDLAINTILSEARSESQRKVDAAKKRVQNSVGDDAQQANVDLQNALQKQQQTLQILSNTSKLLHDTADALIRKIGG